jgi:hypothetical protein
MRTGSNNKTANAGRIEWHVEGISRQQEKDSEGESIGKWANEKSF